MNLLKSKLNGAYAFREWLVSQPPDAIVGYARRSSCCPVANFLLTENFDDCEVMEDNLGGKKGNKFYWLSDRPVRSRNKMPAWVGRFIAIVDKSDTPEISAVIALAALSEAVGVSSELAKERAA